MINSIEDIQQLVVDGFTDWKQYGEVYTRETDDLILFKYLPTAEYEGNWTPLERMSRGLIIEKATGKIIARPFDKFFNFGQNGAVSNSPIERVYEKCDGSLGIMYWYNDQWHIATNGSFDSEQAQAATRMLREQLTEEHLQFLYNFRGLVTILVEIILPENRIVVDYGDTVGLIVLAIRGNISGEYYPREFVKKIGNMGGPFLRPVKEYKFETVADIQQYLDSLTGTELEGFVVEFEDGLRAKFKGSEYLKLHRLKSDITFNNVFDIWASGQVDKFRDGVPDEFLDLFDEYADKFQSVYESLADQVQEAIDDINDRDFESRKDVALFVINTYPSIKSLVFTALDHQDEGRRFDSITKYMKSNRNIFFPNME